MALKNRVNAVTVPYQNATYNYSCTISGGVVLSGSSVSTLDVVVSRVEVANVVSANNKRLRPWSNFSYRKVHSWGGPSTRRLDNLVDCYYWNGWSNVLKRNQVLYQSSAVESPFHRGNAGTGREGWNYQPTRSDADAIALAKVYSALSDSRTQWNLAVTLGEGKETAKHLASVARRLATGFIALKKGRVLDAYRALVGRRNPTKRESRKLKSLSRKGKEGILDDLSSSWMELQFAWKPLLGDIDSASRYIAEKRVNASRPPSMMVSRRHVLERTETWKQSFDTGSSSYELTYWSKPKASVRYTFEVSPTFTRVPSTLDELGFTDPASVAWNLLPLSFVVDWFVNVGQVLESLHEVKHWTCLRGMKSVRTDTQISRVLSRGPTNPLLSFQMPEQGAHWSTFERTFQSGIPVIPLRVKVANPFDLQSGQMASAIVLLRYAFLQHSR